MRRASARRETVRNGRRVMRGGLSRLIGSVVIGLLVVAQAFAFDGGALPIGTRATTAHLSGGATSLDVFTYRPGGCEPTGTLLLFHGNGRGAQSARDSAMPLADRRCLVIVAPLFDRKRFPNWSYHRGGLVDPRGRGQSGVWTVALVIDLLDWTRSVGAPSPYTLFGHSAGGQFLSRVAAYVTPLPDDVARLVVANASTHVLPRLDTPVPYGFGGDVLGDPEGRLAAYLGAPVTIYLGEADIGHEDLTDGPLANAQGANRVDRGFNALSAACRAARRQGGEAAWTLVLAPGIGHSARAMLGSEAIDAALGLSAGGRGCAAHD